MAEMQTAAYFLLFDEAADFLLLHVSLLEHIKLVQKVLTTCRVAGSDRLVHANIP